MPSDTMWWDDSYDYWHDSYYDWSFYYISPLKVDEKKFKVGDVVRLKSGGEGMTITGFTTRSNLDGSSTQLATLSFYNWRSRHLQTEIFPLSSLYKLPA